jgi:DNA-binding GntR family transcriptional regulator
MTPPPRPAPLPSADAPGNRTGRAYEAIRTAILDNQYRPGSHLSENRLAQSLGMSRTPIREALKMLENEGLVEIVNGVGIFVWAITIKELFDLFEVRAALECAALPAALARIGEDEIDGLLDRWRGLKDRIAAGEAVDLAQVMAMDLDLHFLLVDRCGNEVLKGMLDGIRMKIRRYQLDSARALNDVASVVRQHLEILALLKRRDAESLALLLKRHIRQAAANLVQDPGLTV